MSIHWKSLDTSGKIKAVKSVWREGMSARQIAAHFNGATKNAVVGMYSRWRTELMNTPLPDKARPIHRPAASRQEAPVLPDERHGAGRTLMMLARHQCKWPVNEAEPGGIHLFCGLPADGPWCEHHAFRSIRRNPQGD